LNYKRITLNYFRMKKVNFLTTLLLMAVFAISSQNVMAYNLSSCTIYFDNSQWKWSTVDLYIWNNNSNSRWHLTQITGSDYWKVEQNGWNNFTAYNFNNNGSHSSNNLTDELSSSWITRCFSGDNNQNWTLVGPKNVGITTTTTTKGGSGTQADPYIVAPGTTITVTAQGEKIGSNTTVNYALGEGEFNTTAQKTVVSSAVDGQTYSAYVRVCTKQDKYTSRVFSTSSIYFTVESTPAGCDNCQTFTK